MRNGHEKLVKAKLIQYLLEKNHTNDNFIANELVVDSFARRIDIALINNSLYFFEIKTEADNLSRLSGQVEDFLKFCDKLHIICAPCHSEHVLNTTPQKVAVWEFCPEKGIKVIRKGKSEKLLNKTILIKMLTVADLKTILSKNKIKASHCKRLELQNLAMSLSATILRQHVLQKLKNQHREITNQVKEALVSRDINIDDINSLRKYPYHSRVVNQEQECDDMYMYYLSLQSKENIFGNPISIGEK